MVIYTKAEFRAICGDIPAKDLSNYIRRGNVVLNADRLIDLADENNRLFLQRRQAKMDLALADPEVQADLLGDQRKYMIPCPCCGSFIELRWAIEKNGITAGITWKTDETGKLIAGTVGYICQESS